MSLEELLVQAHRQNDFDIIYEAINEALYTYVFKCFIYLNKL